MNIPNYLTFLRILISPIFLVLYIYHEELGISSTTLPYILLGLLVISELTDAFDGFLARRYKQVTELGKILDPLADSIVHISIFMTFTLEPVRLPLPLVFVFFYRDSVISTLRTLCALKGFALSARTSGKIKAVTQAVATFIVLALMIPASLGLISNDSLHQVATIVIGLSALYTAYSGFEYVWANWKYIKATSV